MKTIAILTILLAATVAGACELQPQYYSVIHGEIIVLEFDERLCTINYPNGFISLPYEFSPEACYVEIDGFPGFAVTDTGLVQAARRPIIFDIDGIAEANQ